MGDAATGDSRGCPQSWPTPSLHSAPSVQAPRVRVCAPLLLDPGLYPTADMSLGAKCAFCGGSQLLIVETFLRSGVSESKLDLQCSRHEGVLQLGQDGKDGWGQMCL